MPTEAAAAGRMGTTPADVLRNFGLAGIGSGIECAVSAES